MDNDFWLEAQNINCYKNGNKVVRNLNLKLKYSENVILLGPNGSGKSSLIDLINRNIYPVLTKNGLLKIFNKELINIWELRKRISTVNTEIKDRISNNLRVSDVIISGLYGKYSKILNKSKSDYLTAQTIIKKMHLDKISEKYFSHLSDGEKQIVLVARALIKNPEFLILDEPVANLDYNSKFFVIDHINKISKLNTKILCVTHDISMITKIYNRIIMMKKGTIFADGSQKEVLNSNNINKLFEVNIELFRDDSCWNIKRKSK